MLALLALGACGSHESSTNEAASLPQGSEHVTLDPGRLQHPSIDNPYLPFAVGSKWVYREVEDGVLSACVVTVTPTHEANRNRRPRARGA